MCVSYTEALRSPLCVKPCSPKAKLEIRRPCFLFRPVVCTVETLLCSGLVWPHLQRGKQKQFIMLQTLKRETHVNPLQVIKPTIIVG